jgi:hypothetical protein
MRNQGMRIAVLRRARFMEVCGDGQPAKDGRIMV